MCIRDSAQTGEETMRLLDVEGNELFCAEDLISAQPQSSKARAEQFLAVEAETAMVIDRNGQDLKSKTIPGLSGLYCDREGFYFYEAYNPEGKIRTGMLDATPVSYTHLVCFYRFPFFSPWLFFHFRR